MRGKWNKMWGREEEEKMVRRGGKWGLAFNVWPRLLLLNVKCLTVLRVEATGLGGDVAYCGGNQVLMTPILASLQTQLATTLLWIIPALQGFCFVFAVFWNFILHFSGIIATFWCLFFQP